MPSAGNMRLVPSREIMQLVPKGWKQIAGLKRQKHATDAKRRLGRAAVEDGRVFVSSLAREGRSKFKC